ncbi:hypothetical protein [Blastococcus sp. TF02A-35]|uniref:hypothetical protein n=1 Tax=Blastococcus sp. TF02A-35 TaxID=2559612 RepID=UPI001ADDC851|nr:hypothetical protein [Blastococcus sp. TF02A_35]
MSPFRWDVLLVGFVLALPVLALGMRGDFTTEEMVSRLPWCLLAGWGAVALVRAVFTPPKPVPQPKRRPAARPVDVDEDEERDAA